MRRLDQQDPQRAVGPIADATFATGAEVGDPMLDTGDALVPAGHPDAPEHVGWHPTTLRAHAGSRSFWSTESNDLCVTLEGEVTLTAGESPELSFWTAWDVEPGWDGGVVELSNTGGASWLRLTPAGGYPGTISNGGSLCGIAVGSGAYTGYGQLAFQSAAIDLTPYAGESVRFRFLYRTDGSLTGDGWWVDALAITHAQVPGACAAGAGVFVDDFETGDPARWSGVEPAP